MSILKVNNVNKRFGGNQVLQNVTFNVAENEITGLIGANGAGKTTLFNCVTGFVHPDEGSVVFKEIEVTHKKPHEIARTGITRTFQVVKPFGDMTVIENVMVGAFIKAANSKQAQEMARATLEFLGIDHIKDKLARQLTISDRKKLELARALAAGPKLLLLDEVMGGLRPNEVNEMIEILQKIKDKKITILMIEHIMKAIMTLANHIVVLHHGVKIKEGTPLEVSSDSKVIEAYLGKDEINVAGNF